MIFGYPTETEKDYEDSLDFIRRYKKFAGTAISSITISNTLGILPGTPLYNNLDKLDNINRTHTSSNGSKAISYRFRI